MIAPAQLNSLDPNALADLKRLSRDGNSPEALRATSKQFEALFLQMVLKSMRDAAPSTGMLDNDQTRLFQSLQDQQTATNMAQGRGIGLANVIYRQLGGEALERSQAQPGSGAAAAPGLPNAEAPRVPARSAIPAAALRGAAKSAGSDAAAATALDAAAGAKAAGATPRTAVAGAAAGATANAAATVAPAKPRGIAAGVRDFVERVWSQATEASQAVGIPARFMVAQAALETGWGRGELRRADGSSSHNLFNIKAGPNWKGEVVEVPVTEYANGRAYKTTARFRAYGSYGEAFRDYAKLLSGNPRYADVIGQTDAAGFARSLQQAGYATDPMYADKLARIISGNTLRTALADAPSDRIA